MTDGELLRGAQQGDAAAWRALYQRALPAVWRQAYALVGDAHLAEDISSETMLALLKNVDRLHSDAPKIAGWLRVVVRCKAADHQRKIFRSFLSTLSRYPTDSERELMLEQVAAATTDAERQQALGDVLWALRDSAEFTFNH